MALDATQLNAKVPQRLIPMPGISDSHRLEHPRIAPMKLDPLIFWRFSIRHPSEDICLSLA
jgi:hypothetical protein